MTRPAVYIASKLKYWPEWCNLSERFPEVEWSARWPGIVAKRVQPDGTISEGEDMREVWETDTADVARSDAVFLYGENGEALRGALFEAGYGYACGLTIYCVGNADFGTWPALPGVYKFHSIGDAVDHLLGQG